MKISPIARADLSDALPDTRSTLRLPGLEGPVTIYRDDVGIPHLRAETAHDAFFGQGFVHAQDRLWQMEYDRRRALGRWSEWVGPGGLEVDLQMRRFQIGASLAPDLAALGPQARAMLEAFSEGVNAFLAGAPRLPVEFALVGARPEPWRPADSLAVFKVRHILMGVWEYKIWMAKLLRLLGPEQTARLHPGYGLGQLVVLPPGSRFEGPLLDGLQTLAEGVRHLTDLGEVVDAGSNNWVVGGKKTASGTPLMAGDPHRALEVPNVYYQNHVACPEFDVIGFSFPGLPGFPHFGHNAHVAWCITHGQGDYQDIFIERFDPDRPGRYQVGEEWRAAEISREKIVVKGEDPVSLELYRTHHGPVIGGDPARGDALAFRYTAIAAPNRTMDAVRAMLTARNADELEAAQRSWVDPVNNFLYCDVHGAFGYRLRGELPVRSAANGWLPVPGWTGEHDWRGTVPFEEMPALRNPSAGYVVTANNRPVAGSYPHYIALEFTPGFRAERLNDLLREAAGLTVEGMGAIHADVLSLPGVAFREALQGFPPPLDEPCRKALALLAVWDGRMTGDSAAATIFAAFRHRIAEAVLAPLLGSLAEEAFHDTGRGPHRFCLRVQARLHEAISDDRSPLLPPGATWQGLMEEALRAAVADLRERLGERMESWRWDTLHRAEPQHALAATFPESAPLLNPPGFPLPGDGDTVHAAGYYVHLGFQVTGLTTVARYVFDPGDWNRSGWVIPGGVSGHPGSPHFADQVKPFLEYRLLPMRYDWVAIEQEAATTQRLEPDRA